MKFILFKIITYPVVLIIILILYLIKYNINIRIALLNTGRIGHLALNTEIELRRLSIKKKNNVKKEKTILIAPSLPQDYVANEQLVKMYSRNSNVYKSWICFTFISIWHDYLLKTPFFFKLDVRSNEYKLFNNSNSIINFNSKEHSKGAKMLNDLSIGGNKYVCIFTRDSNYLEIKESEKQNNRSCRDSDIDLMIPSVKHLIKNGYYVVRVGSCAKEKMSLEDDMFIDYPFTNNVSEFNDVYLVANADFFVGTSSGICDIATIFDVPRLGVDMTPFGHAPFGQKSMFIPKKIRNNGAVIPFYDQQLIKFIDNFSCPDLWHLEYEFIDNTESEILLAVIDFISFIDSGFVLNYEYADEMGRYYDFFIKNSRFDGVKTPICPSWYNNNTKLYR